MADARKLAKTARDHLAASLDPIKARDEYRTKHGRAVPTFGEFADEYIKTINNAYHTSIPIAPLSNFLQNNILTVSGQVFMPGEAPGAPAWSAPSPQALPQDSSSQPPKAPAYLPALEQAPPASSEPASKCEMSKARPRITGPPKRSAAGSRADRASAPHLGIAAPETRASWQSKSRRARAG